MEKKEYVIKLTEKEKVIIQQALDFARAEYKKKGQEERSKESGSGIHTVVADKLTKESYDFHKLLIKILDV